MNFLGGIVSALSPDLNKQINDATSTAQQVAGAVAGWGAIIVVELAIVIWLLARKKNV